MHNPYSAGNLVNSIYKIAKKDSSLGTPWHKYDFTQSEEWAEKHGYHKDERGHRDDRVKKPTHPTHPSRGTWKGMNQFHLTDKGIKDVNHTLVEVMLEKDQYHIFDFEKRTHDQSALSDILLQSAL
jgi:hypothetical protein